MKQCTEQYNFIFAGPPYALTNIDEIPLLVFEKQLLLPGGIFILEHTPRNDYQQHPHFTRIKNYGTTVFTFFTQPA
jgi:16S rRNA G966 N2-methylase RsmD